MAHPGKPPDKANCVRGDTDDDSEDGDYMGESDEEGTSSLNSMVSLVDEDELNLEAEV